jgi:small GTP-binding protein
MAKSDKIKVVLLGESGVGKTCIVLRFAKGTFNASSGATLGATFLSKSLELQEYGVTLNYQIWDTAGQEKYRSLAAMYYQDALAAVLVYDITHKESFAAIEYWMKELKDRAPPGIKIVIAANKADLVESEQVKAEDAKQYAQDHGAIFQMTSAKDGMGINEIFVEIAKGLGKLDPSNAGKVQYFLFTIL